MTKEQIQQFLEANPQIEKIRKLMTISKEQEKILKNIDLISEMIDKIEWNVSEMRDDYNTRNNDLFIQDTLDKLRYLQGCFFNSYNED